jgi:hypothetical protein
MHTGQFWWRCALSCALASVALATGCAGDGEGLDENGRPVGEGGGGPGAVPLFTQIQNTIFTPICTQCHVGATAPVGLRLDAANSYALLVGRASVEVPGILRVSPGNPDGSYLVQKIEGRAAVGGRMPLGGPPLPQASIDLIRQWISQGAVAPTAAGGPAQPMQVVSTIPGADEEIEGASSVMVIFSSAVDASLAGTGVFELRASGGDGSFAEGNETAIGLARIDVSLSNPTVVTLGLNQPLAPDSYQLVVHGTGPTVLADVHAHALDGDANGTAGGDFRAGFSVTGKPVTGSAL